MALRTPCAGWARRARSARTCSTTGVHAPGLQDDRAALRAAHHLLLAHGEAVAASMRMRLDMATSVMPLGIAMGLLVVLMNFISNVWVAAPFLILLGALGGYLVVPMNALLQHRGHNLMGAGRSIAVQNFNEQACILALGAFYTGLSYQPNLLSRGTRDQAIAAALAATVIGCLNIRSRSASQPARSLSVSGVPAAIIRAAKDDPRDTIAFIKDMLPWGKK